MSAIKITGEKREEIGKHLGVLRKSGYVPAVLYGAGAEAEAVKVKIGDLERVYKEAGGSALVDLEVGEKSVKVVIHDISHDPVSRKFLHVDFYRIRMDKKLRVDVPLVFEGKAPAVDDFGAILAKNIHSMEVESLPADLPRNIKVDLTGLKNIGDVIHVSDLIVPVSVKILKDPQEIVVVAEEPRSEAELEKLEETPTAADISEIKVAGEEEKKKKKEEEEALRKEESKEEKKGTSPRA